MRVFFPLPTNKFLMLFFNFIDMDKEMAHLHFSYSPKIRYKYPIDRHCHLVLVTSFGARMCSSKLMLGSSHVLKQNKILGLFP